jgi:hypothetical protein
MLPNASAADIRPVVDDAEQCIYAVQLMNGRLTFHLNLARA